MMHLQESPAAKRGLSAACLEVWPEPAYSKTGGFDIASLQASPELLKLSHQDRIREGLI